MHTPFKKRPLRIAAITVAAAVVLAFAVNAAMEFGLIDPMYKRAILAGQKLTASLRKARIKAVERRGLTFDPRSEEEFLKDESARDPRLIMSQCAGDFASPYFREKGYLPLAGQSKVPTLAGKENGQYLTYLSDRHGLRNPDYEWDVGNSEAGLDIILAGASFAQGYLATPDKTIAGRARSHGLHVLSLGCNSHGPLKSLASLREFGHDVKTKYVVYLFGGTEYLKNLKDELEDPILTKYLADPAFSQHLIDDQAQIDKDIRTNYNLWLSNKNQFREKQRKLEQNDSVLRRLLFGRYLRTDAVYLFRKFKTSMIDHETAGPRLENKLAEILFRMKQASEASGARFLFLYVPNLWELYSPAGETNLKALTLRAARSQGIDILDMEPALRKIQPTDNLFDLGGMAELQTFPNKYGPGAYEIIANSIIAHLKK